MATTTLTLTVLYCIWQNFRWLKFSPKAHTMYWVKNFAKFNFTNCTSYLLRSCGWSSWVAMRICACARMCQNFHCAKKFAEKIFANGMHWRNWRKFSPGENFHVYGSTIVAWQYDTATSCTYMYMYIYMYIRYRLLYNNCSSPLQSLALFFVGTIGSSMLCYATPYTPETMPVKIGTFALFTSVMGVTLAPLIAMAGMWYI